MLDSPKKIAEYFLSYLLLLLLFFFEEREDTTTEQRGDPNPVQAEKKPTTCPLGQRH